MSCMALSSVVGDGVLPRKYTVTPSTLGWMNSMAKPYMWASGNIDTTVWPGWFGKCELAKSSVSDMAL